MSIPTYTRANVLLTRGNASNNLISIKLQCWNVVSDDHSRVKLKEEINPSRSDYINASTIVRFYLVALSWSAKCGRYLPSRALTAGLTFDPTPTL